MIEYKEINFDEIHLIENLWEQNRQYHEWTSEHFSHRYKGLKFEERMVGFELMKTEHIKITVAIEDKMTIGYCLSVIENGIGELATLHVLHDKRKKGIGQRLVDVHLEWLKSSCKEIKVTVSQENSQTISFYKNLGFYSNALEMIYKES